MKLRYYEPITVDIVAVNPNAEHSATVATAVELIPVGAIFQIDDVAAAVGVSATAVLMALQEQETDGRARWIAPGVWCRTLPHPSDREE